MFMRRSLVVGVQVLRSCVCVRNARRSTELAVNETKRRERVGGHVSNVLLLSFVYIALADYQFMPAFRSMEEVVVEDFFKSKSIAFFFMVPLNLHDTRTSTRRKFDARDRIMRSHSTPVFLLRHAVVFPIRIGFCKYFS